MNRPLLPLLLALGLMPRLAAAGTCGPADAFGYQCFDEADSAGAPFSWETPPTLVDEGAPVVALPFTFWFYGEPYDEVRLSVDGYLVFGASGSVAANNSCLGTGTGSVPFAAAFWENLVLGASGTLRSGTFGVQGTRHHTLSWSNVERQGLSNGTVSVQIKLFEGSNVLEMHYLDTDVGIANPGNEGGAATAGLFHPVFGFQQYSCDAPSLPDQRTLRFDAGCTELDGDGVTSCGGDCDDEDPDVGPLVQEDCANGIDDDCDQDVDGADVDCAGDDDDSGDDDDATGDDDDATSDDDDATSDDDDSGDESGVHIPVGCLSGCAAGGAGGGTLLALALVLCGLRSRRGAGLALLLLLPGLALAGPAIVGEDGERPVQIGGDQAVGGLWILGATPEFVCPESSVPLAVLSDGMAQARRSIDELDLAAGAVTLAELRQTLPCLQGPPDTEDLWGLHFLEAVALQYGGRAPAEVEAALLRAHAVRAGQPFDQSYPPELREAFLATQREAMATGRARVLGAGVAASRPGALWVDGRLVPSEPLDVIPGRHLVQLRDAGGQVRGLVLRLGTDDALLVALPERAAAVRAGAPPSEQRRIDNWVLAYTGGEGSLRWEDPVLAPGSESEPEAPVRRSPPRVLVLLGGGYGLTALDSYGQAALDLSVGIVGPLRVDAIGRLGFAPVSLGPQQRAVSLLGLFGAGLSLRVPTPSIASPVVGVAAQLGPNADGSEGAPWLGGVVGRVGLDLAPRGGFALRVLAEAGVLGRFFSGRALLQVGVGFGG